MPLKITSKPFRQSASTSAGPSSTSSAMGAIVLRQKWSRRQVEARLQLRNTNLKPALMHHVHPVPVAARSEGKRFSPNE
jgi:hypothetical protein